MYMYLYMSLYKRSTEQWNKQISLNKNIVSLETPAVKSR